MYVLNILYDFNFISFVYVLVNGNTVKPRYKEVGYNKTLL